MRLTSSSDPESNADFSDCMQYRYTLRRRWGEGSTLVVIGLNPSTADHEFLDPTLRRCVDYGKRWGHGSLVMLNLFAFRATQPEDMKRQTDPIGPENNIWIAREARNAGLILAAWGHHGQHLQRDVDVITMLHGHELFCLKRNGDGTPKHPLYCAKALVPIAYSKKFLAARSDF